MQQPRFQRIVDVEAQVVELAVAAEHFGLAAGVELDPATRLQRLAGADLRPRLVARLQALAQDLDPPTAPGLGRKIGLQGQVRSVRVDTGARGTMRNKTTVNKFT